RIRDEIPVAPNVEEVLVKALVAVTSDGEGTAHRAQVKGIKVAGKTGTAQWGPTGKQRTAAWFTGFLPADDPQFAFGALYEGEPNDNTVHGGSHAAPLIGKVFKEIFAPTSSKDNSKSDNDEASPEEDASADESG